MSLFDTKKKNHNKDEQTRFIQLGWGGGGGEKGCGGEPVGGKKHPPPN